MPLQRRQFLAEALEAVVGVAAPGESDQLKQCIAVLRVRRRGCEGGACCG